MSPLAGGRQHWVIPYWHVRCCTSVTGCNVLYSIYFTLYCNEMMCKAYNKPDEPGHKTVGESAQEDENKYNNINAPSQWVTEWHHLRRHCRIPSLKPDMRHFVSPSTWHLQTRQNDWTCHLQFNFTCQYLNDYWLGDSKTYGLHTDICVNYVGSPLKQTKKINGTMVTELCLDNDQ